MGPESTAAFSETGDKKLSDLDRGALIAPIIRDWNHKTLNYATGRHCVGLADAGVKALTGESLIPSYGRAANTEKAALRALKKLGDVDTYLDIRFKEIPPLEALAGDIVAFPGEGYKYSFGLGAGAGFVAVFLPLNGVNICLVDQGLSAAVKAWRVEPKVS